MPVRESPSGGLPALRSEALTLVSPALILVGLALVAYFDLHTNTVISDEYARRWTIQHFLAGRGLTFWGFSPNLDFAALALVPGALGLDPKTWRLTGLPFLLGAGIFAYLSARELGASRFWSSIGAVAFVCCPVTLSVGTGMMTETAYVGLEAAAIFFALRWIRRGTHRWWTVLMIALLPLQRQQGIVIAGTLALGLILAAPRRPLLRRDFVALGAALVIGLAAVGLTYWLHRNAITAIGNTSPHYKSFAFSVAFSLYILAGLCPILGLVSLPFVSALLRRPPEDRLRSWAGVVTVPVAMIGVVVGLVAVMPHLKSVFPGDHVAVSGIGPASLSKPDLLPGPLFVAFELFVIVSFLVVLIWRRRDWSPKRLGPEAWFLVLTAVIQLSLIFLEGLVFDRYYLAVLLPLMPLFAVWASNRVSDTRSSRWFAVGACLVLVLYFGVGQQDYMAWSNARDRAATIAFSQVASPADVAAGVEEDEEHVWIPAADQPAANLPRAVSAHPKIGLVTVGPSDPRPGIAYSSVAPGKVVLVYATPRP